ncbi:MarR family transcriptional regulator [Evansella clarkii]|uniref:MarR family transcriptional regulator n=1 Tax=Evansella clarkii TaxID=79879 RepID=UPI0009975318|nr:MarR family transcriptional regulator [Evansella clarkii]
MSVNRNNHLLLNYIRGIGKVLEEEWQQNAKALGLTLAEQHIMWIVHSKEKISVSHIAKIGLWDRSTVMQVIKRLQEKKLVRMLKDERDLRITYIELTEEGKLKRNQSKEKDFELFSFLNEYQKENEEFIEELIRFHREVNLHFHGREFVDWVEETTENYDEW